jgi:hypothetical protein
MAEDFIWSLRGPNKHHFTAFGNLLALRNGGQVEPASLCEELLSKEQPASINIKVWTRRIEEEISGLFG